MANWNRSKDVNSDPEHSGGTSRALLPRPDKGDDVFPVPLWEREFCRNAYNIPWETFCENKRFIQILFKNVMDWDDSGAFKNFEEAKGRFRAKYHGEPFEDPELDSDMYIDEVDHHCKVDPDLVADLDKTPHLYLVADPGMANLTPMSCGEPIGNLIPTGWGEPAPNLAPTGWGETADPAPVAASGHQGNEPETIWVVRPCTPSNSNNNFNGGGASNNWQQQRVVPGQASSGTARMLPSGGRTWSSGVSSGGARNRNGGGGGGNGGGRNWNGGGGGCRNWNGGGSSRNWNGGGRGNNQRNQAVGPHQQRIGGGGGMQRRSQNEGQHQMMRSGGRQQQQQQAAAGGQEDGVASRPAQHASPR